MIEFILDGPEGARATVAIAHGAGAPMDSPFMIRVAQGLGERGIRVARFEFPYMAARRAGRRRPPDRAPVLLATWREVVGQLGGTGPRRGRPIVVAGKSMGGRIASMIADDVAAAGLVCLGYPFRPRGVHKPDRVAHLAKLATPTLILQGERDPFGGPAVVAEIELSPKIRVVWVPDGDHDFKPRRASGRGIEDNLALAISAAADFVIGL
jgi:predicted alpha/beta-hydrolase family hydrolase